MSAATTSERSGETLEAAVEIEVPTAVYPLEVIYRTCYAFTARAYLWIVEAEKPDLVRVCLHPKGQNEDLRALRGEFGNALVDFAVRWSVARETGAVREALVTLALRGR